MLESVKNSLLASLGLVAMAQEKLQECVRDLVDKGELTKEQGKKLVDSFVEKGKKGAQALPEKMGREVTRLLEKSPVVSRQEFRALQERVRQLEARLASAAPDELEPMGER
jgi:polyhydroxyalkanoate synthesis regulator phasin